MSLQNDNQPTGNPVPESYKFSLTGLSVKIPTEKQL